MGLPTRLPSSGKLHRHYIYRYNIYSSSYFAPVEEDDGDDPTKRIVELSFEVDYSEDEIVIINQCIQTLQEWKQELLEPNLTGREPYISKNWERLPHETDGCSHSSKDDSCGESQTE